MKQLPLYQPHFIRIEKEFKDWLQVLGYSPSSVYTLPLHAREFLHYLERQRISDLEHISSKETKAFFTCLYQRGNQRKAGQPLSTAYLNKYLQALRLLSKYLRQTGQSTFSIKRQFIQQQYTLKNILSQAEIQLLYDTCELDTLGLRDRAMLSVFYGCGLRRNEGISLDLSDLLLDNGMLYVRKGKNYKERYVPISEQIIKDLKNYINYSRSLFYNSSSQKALFISKKGNRTNGQSLNIRLQRLAEKAEINTEISLHSLRHSIASHLLENGMKVRQIANFLGHSSLESTQIYTRVQAIQTKNA